TGTPTYAIPYQVYRAVKDVSLDNDGTEPFDWSVTYDLLMSCSPGEVFVDQPSNFHLRIFAGTEVSVRPDDSYGALVFGFPFFFTRYPIFDLNVGLVRFYTSSNANGICCDDTPCGCLPSDAQCCHENGLAKLCSIDADCCYHWAGFDPQGAVACCPRFQ